MIFQRCFGDRFYKGNEHLWCHIDNEAADFDTPTFERETGVAINVLCTGFHSCMLLYALDELFYVYKRGRANNLDAHCMVACETTQGSVTPLYGVAWQ